MSLSTRAAIALALMIGFYVFALAVAFGLLWIPLAELAYLHRLDLRIGVGCVIGAGIVLWSIVPRRDHFEAPGPWLDPAQQPRLFAEVASIAQSVGQEMPHEVYLLPEINAWVAQRGGIAGFGSRRVMALGLPLLSLLTVSQFRAVLAHEFGHYHAGDTRLGVWVYKTRSAIRRTVQNLGRQESWVYYLFNWYSKLFLRVTLAISRAQEYAADQLASQVAGADALIEGLKQSHRGQAAWIPYMQTEWLPVVSEGYCPPLSRGLQLFLQVPEISTPVEELLATELKEGKAAPLDSHPSLAERIAALRNPVNGSATNGTDAFTARPAEDNVPASSLLEGLEHADNLLGLSAIDQPLCTLAWEDVLQSVWVPVWNKQISSQTEALRGVTVGQIGQQLYSRALREKLKNPAGVWPTTEQRAEMTRGIAGCAFCLVLLHDGWTFHTLPGQMFCEKNGERIQPFKLVRSVSTGELSAEKWQEMCERAGIRDLPLIMEQSSAAAN
jgi:Zn-dependent protease with chaperone function